MSPDRHRDIEASASSENGMIELRMAGYLSVVSLVLRFAVWPPKPAARLYMYLLR